jgi:Pentapeptide repeats (9 copies)
MTRTAEGREASKARDVQEAGPTATAAKAHVAAYVLAALSLLGVVGVLCVAADDEAVPPAGARDQAMRLLASGAPLAGMDFTSLPLAGLEVSGLDLKETKWGQADLRGARFTKCDLQGADFAGAALQGATFQSCNLAGASLVGATLPGAYLGTCDLSGADLSKADTFGATLVDVAVSPTGGTYLPAIGMAIELRDGPRVSPAWLAAASGDAFAFTYDRANRAALPSAPMSFDPAVVALDTLGYAATYRTEPRNSDEAYKELSAVLRRGLVAMLPLRLAGAAMRGEAVEGGVWVVAHQLTAEKGKPEIISVRTPFGPLDLPRDDLLRRWEGPWPTLLPAGTGPFLARYSLCVVGAQKAETAQAGIALTAFRHASALMHEPRSFGQAFGGFDAYRALIEDAGSNDVPVAELVAWSGAPRRYLAAARRLAAAFLREAGPSLPAPAQGPAGEAAMWYDQIATLLTSEWPLPPPEAFQGEGMAAAADLATTRRPHARMLLEEALIRERRAVALLEQAVADSVKAAG